MAMSYPLEEASMYFGWMMTFRLNKNLFVIYVLQETWLFRNEGESDLCDGHGDLVRIRVLEAVLPTGHLGIWTKGVSTVKDIPFDF